MSDKMYAHENSGVVWPKLGIIPVDQKVTWNGRGNRHTLCWNVLSSPQSSIIGIRSGTASLQVNNV